jgi:hypothetical protein
MGLPKTAGIYDYTADLLQKYKADIADKVKELLSQELYTATSNVTPVIKKVEEIRFEDVTAQETQGETDKETINTVNTVNTNKTTPEFKESTKLNVVEVKVISNGEKKKRGNNNKIQKVDFDFDFDNFNDANFSSFTANNNETKNEQSGEDLNSSAKKKKKSYDEEEEEKENSYYKPKISQEEINKKFANKKAISSDDYARLEEDPSQNDSYKSKINSMKYSKAISSSDLYGEPEEGKRR